MTELGAIRRLPGLPGQAGWERTSLRPDLLSTRKPWELQLELEKRGRNRGNARGGKQSKHGLPALSALSRALFRQLGDSRTRQTFKKSLALAVVSAQTMDQRTFSIQMDGNGLPQRLGRA